MGHDAHCRHFRFSGYASAETTVIPAIAGLTASCGTSSSSPRPACGSPRRPRLPTAGCRTAPHGSGPRRAAPPSSRSHSFGSRSRWMVSGMPSASDLRLERELQVRRQVAVVGEQGLPAHVGERVVVGQPEGHADPIVLVLLRQRLRDDGRRLLDGDGGAVVGFEVLLPEPHRLQFQPVPLAPLLVDRVHALEGRPVPGDEERRLALGLMDLLDRPRPAAQGDVGEVGVTDAVLDPHLVPRLEARRDRFGSCCGPWVTPRRDRPLRSAGM